MSSTSVSVVDAPLSPLSVSVSDTGGGLRVAVAGELDLATVAQLEHALRRLPVRARAITLDLRELGFIDCSGAQLLLALTTRVRRAGGRLVVTRGAGQVGRLFALTGLDRRLELLGGSSSLVVAGCGP